MEAEDGGGILDLKVKYTGAVLRIRWIRKILASWIRIRKNMRIHGSGSKGVINQKLPQKKTFLLPKPKSELLKKERL